MTEDDTAATDEATSDTSTSSTSSRWRSSSLSTRGSRSSPTANPLLDLNATLADYNVTLSSSPDSVLVESTLVTSSDATFWQYATITPNSVASGAPGIAVAAAIAAGVLVLGVLTVRFALCSLPHA